VQFTTEQQQYIDEHYLLLPVDADGVPIHVGDEMFGDCPSGKYVNGCVTFIGENRFMLGNVQFYLRGDYMHHVKPRTLEDVLREMVGMTDQPLCEEDIKAFADEIRELLGFEIDEPDTIRNELEDNGHTAKPCHIGELIIGR